MPRTRLLKRLSRMLNVAIFQERHQLKDHQVHEILDWSRDPITRRRFLTQAGLAGIGIPALAACQTPGSQLQARAPTRDVIIVGAGTAGLTAAYYLAKAGIGSAIYEGSARVGGRMFTEQKFNDEGMFCELGGEFVDTGHEDLIKLCADLGVGVENLTVDEKFPVQEVYFSRNRVRSEKEVIAAFKPLAARLIEDAKALQVDGELTVPTYNSELAKSARVKELDRMNLAEYIKASRIEAWLADLISNAYVGEYGLDAAQQSALNMIVLIEPGTADGFKIFGESDEAKRIQGGSETLPKALAKTVSEAVPITFEHKLMAVRDQGTHFTLTFDHSGKTVDVTGKRLVLAVPAPLLKEIDLKGVDLSPVKRQAIAEWGFGTNSKLMLGFQKRPWEKNPNVHRGFSLLPDQTAQEYWDTSIGQKGTRGIVTCFLGGESGRVIAPTQQVQALDFLDRIFPGTKAAFDGKRMLMHWPSQKLTQGSYTCSKPGQYTTIYGAFGEAELNRRLVFAGEHCSSDWSGYMNGAVQSGKQAADLLLGRTAAEG
ncbi:flavin monoamine oxidase family protein [Oligoflexus tunisiensis]|uniref:flavin monoamine oxidase family protein n=1 Tax=Oligoflexus tunisiensis TaxID=708132 RepID=UPI00114D1CF6|nr:NAD(P)/FAD-dependent oxidoreductase [Oligoflexus tunisiensis]